jgi:uncharacterized delta-60 repeat protein
VLVGLLLLPLPAGAVWSGDLDPSFGGDGTMLTDFGSGSSDVATALALQPDGKIVVAGVSYGSNTAFALARYLPNSTLDSSFSRDGRVDADFGIFSDSHDQARALALQPNGKIVVAGYSLTSGGEEIALARCLPNGTLDATFSGDGKVTGNTISL